MCTLSWEYSQAGLDLFFNRDESLDRPEAEPPVVEYWGGISTLMPRDPVAGGSWIAANSQGMVIALLNNYRYPARVPAGEAISRGLLVRRLSLARTVADVRGSLSRETLALYPPFFLLVFDGGKRGPFKWEWDGKILNETWELPEKSFSSSSLMPRLVPALRHYLVHRALKHCAPNHAASTLLDLHRNRGRWPSSIAIAMKRKGRATVSLTHIRVTPGSLNARYWPGHPSASSSRKPFEAHLTLTQGVCTGAELRVDGELTRNKCAAGVSVLQRPA